MQPSHFMSQVVMYILIILKVILLYHCHYYRN